MSSFQSSVSGKINHGLAGFDVTPLGAGESASLSDDAAWLLDYIHRRTGDGMRFAARAALNPAEMKRMLPYVLILEPSRSATGTLLDIKVRLMGTRVSWFYGEAGGGTVRNFADHVAAKRALELANICLDTMGPVVGRSHRKDPSVPYFGVTVLMVPLADDGHIISHFFAHVHIDSVEK